jgi:DNA-binding MarR family transcriptional regulator
MDLVDRLGLAKSTVSRVVASMVERGWVGREATDSDGRGIILMLTDEGVDAAARLQRARRQRMEALLERVPSGRRGDVVEVLRMLQEAADVTDQSAHRLSATATSS